MPPEGRNYELDELNDGPEAASPVLSVAEFRILEQVVGELRRSQQEGQLDDLDRDTSAEVDAETGALESQLRSPKPKRAILREALRSLRSVFEQTLGGAAGAGVVIAVQEATRHIH